MFTESNMMDHHNSLKPIDFNQTGAKLYMTRKAVIFSVCLFAPSIHEVVAGSLIFAAKDVRR